MAIPTTKLLKIGGPALTGIGGVFATSSLVSKSADEKPEKKLKTSALKDEEPPIEEYEDANEGECKKTESNPCKGGQKPSGSKGEKGEKGDQEAQGGKGGGGQSASQQGGETQTGSDSPQELEGDDKEKGQEDSGASEEDTGKSSTSSSEEDGDDSNNSDNDDGKGVTEDGAEDAQHNHASGTAYGTEDRTMTLQDLERTKRTRSDLENLKSQLLGLIGT